MIKIQFKKKKLINHYYNMVRALNMSVRKVTKRSSSRESFIKKINLYYY